MQFLTTVMVVAAVVSVLVSLVVKGIDTMAMFFISLIVRKNETTTVLNQKCTIARMWTTQQKGGHASSALQAPIRSRPSADGSQRRKYRPDADSALPEQSRSRPSGGRIRRKCHPSAARCDDLGKIMSPVRAVGGELVACTFEKHLSMMYSLSPFVSSKHYEFFCGEVRTMHCQRHHARVRQLIAVIKVDVGQVRTVLCQCHHACVR